MGAYYLTRTDKAVMIACLKFALSNAKISDEMKEEIRAMIKELTE